MNATGTITFRNGNENIERFYASLSHRKRLIEYYQGIPYNIMPDRTLNEQSERLYDNRLFEYNQTHRRREIKKYYQREYGHTTTL